MAKRQPSTIDLSRPPRERYVRRAELQRKTLAWVLAKYESIFGAWDGEGAVEPTLRQFREERQAFELMNSIIDAFRSGASFQPSTKNVWCSALRILVEHVRPHVEEFEPHMKLHEPATVLELVVKYAADNLARREGARRPQQAREVLFVSESAAGSGKAAAAAAEFVAAKQRIKRAITDRDLAYVALLAGYFPRMKPRDDGHTAGEVIAATRKAVRAIREQEPKTGRRNRKAEKRRTLS